MGRSAPSRAYPAAVQTVPPTAGPLAACPHCGTRVDTPAGPVGFEYGLGVVGYQHCPSCGSRWRYLWQAQKRRRGRGFVLPGLVVLVVVALLAGGIALVATRGPDYPSHWDTRIQPIAFRVARLRGLTFKHPVKVNFLPPAAFNKLVAASPDDLARHRDEIDQSQRLLRAAGLIGAHVDLAQAVNTTQVAGTLAFYDESTKQIYVRGTGPLDAQTRVTLAHELTHVLQDQDLGLGKLRRRAENSTSGSEDAFRALVEGDASRIEGEYLRGLSEADRNAYVQQSLKSSADAGKNAKDVPAVVETYFDAPYIFGTPIAQVIAAAGGNAAVDAALDGKPPSTRIYFDPSAVAHTPELPPVPDLLSGEKKLKTYARNDESLDAFDFFLMLAARLDLPTALRAADAYKSASTIAYDLNGKTCFRASVAGVSPAGNAFLASTLKRWAETMPDAGASPTTTGVVLRSCDPGRAAETPSNERIIAATRLVAARDQLVASLARQPVPSALAVCAARLLVREPDFAAAINSNSSLADPSPQMLRESADAGATCRPNPSAGIP
jgi:hypothetical protein